jgi:hypothetical protein
MKFKNYIETESGIKDTSTSPGTAGQLLSSTVTGTSWIDQNTISSGSSEVVDIQVKNISAADGGINLKKGDPVYIYGSVGASARLYVDLADSDSTATNNLGDNKMPCVALLDQDLAPNIEGTATVVGKLRNLITSPIDGATPNENDTVYVKSGGGLTLTKPVGSTNLIQNVGQVGRVSTSADGNIVVAALLRSNDVPNLPTGRLFVGTATNTSLVSDVVYVDDANDRVGIGTNNPSYQLQVTGDSSDAPLFQVDDSGDPYLQIKPDSNTFFKIGDMGGLGNEAFIEGNYFDLKFNVAGNTTMTLEGNNRVGIGTTSPDSKLEVASTDDITYLHVRNDSTGSTRLKMSNLTDTNSNGFQIINNGLNGQVNLINYKSTTLAIWTSGSQRMTIRSNGDVGINTTTPTSKLHSVTTASGPVSYPYRAAILGVNDSTDTFYANSVGVAGQVRTSGGYAIYGDAYGAGGWAGYFDGKGYFSNNVGIGTTSPDVKLEVESTASASGIRIKNTNSGFASLDIESNRGTGANLGGLRYRKTGEAYSQAEINYVAGTRFDFLIGNGAGYPSNKLSILNNGNVGIGTTSPSEKLVIRNSTSNTSVKILSYNNAIGTEATLKFATVASDVNYEKAAIITRNYASSFGRSDMHFALDSAADSGNVQFSDTKMTILNNGYVGIGTTSPQEKVHISGSSNVRLEVEATDSTVAALKLTNTAGSYASFVNAAGDLSTFHYNTSTTRTTLLANGNLGINNTNPAQKLDVLGNIKMTETAATTDTDKFVVLDSGVLKYRTGTQVRSDIGAGNISSSGFTMDDAAQIKTYQSTNSGSSQSAATLITENDISIGGCINWWSELQNGSFGSYNHAVFYHAGSFAGAIRRSGNTTVQYLASSDYRLKENVVEITDGIERVKQLKPSRFNFIGEDRIVDGFLAHEVQDIVPESISGEKDEVDNDGNPVYQGIDQSKIVPLLAGALKEAIAKIESLEARIQVLENQ